MNWKVSISIPYFFVILNILTVRNIGVQSLSFSFGNLLLNVSSNFTSILLLSRIQIILSLRAFTVPSDPLAR